ncbi:serine hydrolase domain-containing protein [Carnobacterium gallinarum]|uniref:serine hydrolase domain-containing protein n=1 Tax=Carnobacterium gallinarum TaxID=2749 RepID=UPI0005516B41|nr:serine hydrolase domain-containing protein [Carnobacterium gallinarum]
MTNYPKTQSMVAELIAEGTIPGASYAFIEPQEIRIYREGHAAIFPEEEPILENELYDLASVTKVMMTATLILQLWEAGSLDIEDSVTKYLPEFSQPQVTIRHLLTHTSALNGYIENRDSLSSEELSEAFMHLTVGENFGKEVLYTDTSMILLGFIIEKITNQTVTTVFEERISRPLELKETLFKPTNPLQCAPTENHPVRGMIRGEVHDPKALVLYPHCGSAGLFSSLQDVIRFSQMMLNGGSWKGVQILKEATVEQLMHDWTPTGDLNRSLGWAFLGSADGAVPNRYLLHTGFTGTIIILDLVKKRSFVFLSNRVHVQMDTPYYLKRRNILMETYIAESEVLDKLV